MTTKTTYFQKEQSRLEYYHGILELMPAKAISKTHKALYYMLLAYLEKRTKLGEHGLITDPIYTASYNYLREEIKATA